MTQLERDIQKFANKRWPHRDRLWIIRRLGRELGELCEAMVLLEQDPASRAKEIAFCLEAADMAILLSDLVYMIDRDGINGRAPKSLTAWMGRKLEMLKG